MEYISNKHSHSTIIQPFSHFCCHLWLEKSNTSIWKVFLCCQTDKSGEIWLLFVSFAGLYVGCYTDSLRIKPVCLHWQTLPWSRGIRPSSQHQSQGKIWPCEELVYIILLSGRVPPPVQVLCTQHQDEGTGAQRETSWE